jgi:ATP-dependent RNA helicase DeaD
MNQFEALGLNPAIIKAITGMGFETPTPIQEKVIPLLLEGSTDLVALAQTGTGKTAAFGLPLAMRLDFTSRQTQALILCPTRELCMQIAKDIKTYTAYIPGVNVVPVYGGASINGQITDIKRGAQIIVATPGRMVDLINRKRVDLSKVQYAILDEADEMLNMGFKEDLDMILSQTPDTKSVWLFSATMPDDVLRISKKYMDHPKEITVGSKNMANENIQHLYYVVHARDKYAALKRIADYNPDIFAIVFCRTKIETQQVADMLIKDGYNADALHGDLSQAQRDMVMKRYRSHTLQMLVATDVAGRGIDVNDVTHVINYNLPDELENYTHRSGRTARAGKTGVSIVIINMRELGVIKTLERMIQKKFKRAEVPTGFQVCEKQLFYLVKKLHSVEVNEDAIVDYMPKIYEQLNDLSKEDIIKRLVSVEFNRFAEYYKKAPDLNTDSHREERGDRGDRADRNEHSYSRGGGGVKLFVNIGRRDKLDKDSLTDYISQTANVERSKITYANVQNSFSFIEVPPESVDTIMSAFKDQRLGAFQVRIEVSEEKRERKPSRFGRDSNGGGYRGNDRSSGGGYKGKRDKDRGGYKKFSHSGR